MKFKLIPLILVAVLSLVACTSEGGNTKGEVSEVSEDDVVTRDIFAMDTYMTLTAYGENADDAVTEAVDEINRIDKLISSTDEDSEIYKLNTSGSEVLSEDTSAMLSRAIELNELTDGAFNIATYPIVELWGFIDEQYKLPSQEEIDALLPYTDMSLVSFDSNTNQVTFLDDQTKIGLGAIAKGYTSDVVIEIFKKHGIEHGMINLGGNVEVLGNKIDGTDWNIAVADPYGESDYAGVVQVSDMAVITSGGYERYFEEDGVRYHHIFNPDTGYPAESGVISVTIVSEDGVMADGLSTSLFVMGLDKATEYWRQHSSDFDFIIITDDGNSYITEGLEGIYTPTSGELTVVS